jgi:hypothetical protein
MSGTSRFHHIRILFSADLGARSIAIQCRLDYLNKRYYVVLTNVMKYFDDFHL